MAEPGRRRGPDLLFRSLRWMALIGWGLMFAALVVLDKAKPEMMTIFERYYGIRLRTWWDAETAGHLRPLLWAGLAVSILGLAGNALRHRRSSDEWRLNLWLLLLTSLAGLLLYFRSF